MAREGKAVVLNQADFDSICSFCAERAHAERNIAILSMGYYSGQRIGSIAQIKLSDILEADSIKSIVVLKRKYTKGHRTTECYFSSAKLIEALSAYLKVRQTNRKVEEVFITRLDTAFSPNSMAQLVLKIMRDAGYEGASSHSLRRSFGTRLHQEGASLAELRVLLSHKNIQTTLGYIDHDPVRLSQLVSGG